MKTIGMKLKELRKKAKLSQQQLADYLEIGQDYLCKMETGDRKVSYEVLNKLAILYGCSIEDFDLDNIEIQLPNFSLRSKEITNIDLKDLAAINEIAYNSKIMARAIEAQSWQIDWK